MDQKILFDLIKEAQLHLVKNPQNEAHEITHHYRTWLNAKIVSESLLEEFDINILELICWWHDVKVSEIESGKRVCETTANFLSSKFDSKISEIIYDSILNHEFGSKPNFIEGKILQDADKLEILSPERFRIAINAIKTGNMSKDYFYNAAKVIKAEWLPKMQGLYNFEESKQLHGERLKQLDFDKLLEEISLL